MSWVENQKVKNWGWGWTIIRDSRVHKQINISLFFQLFSLFFIVSAWKNKEIWLHDEIINSFLYMLTKKTDVPYIAAQLQHLLWRKKNRSENFGKMRVCYLSLSFSFPSIQTTLDFSCRKHIWKGHWGSWSTCDWYALDWYISTKRLPNRFKPDANEIWFNICKTSKHQTS